MQLSPLIRHGWDAVDSLAQPWDLLLAACTDGLRGPDATCSPIWARALGRTHLKEVEPHILTVSSGSDLRALVPTFRARTPALPFVRRELRAITEAHGGRSGLLLAGDDPELMDFVLGQLREQLAPWDVFVFSVTEGSASHAGVISASQRRSLRLRCIGVTESPYIELADSWEEMLARLPKKMRWTIRKSESSLRERGTLEYREFRAPQEVGELLAAMYSVERGSWKEQAGTSVTGQPRQQQFYEALADAAAHGGVLSAHVLRLGGQAIAYVLGIASVGGVFLDLKESFDASYADFSPGHVLKRFTMETLMSRGTRIYDFMGNCEPYKMRWTDRTYRSLTLGLYNRTPRGLLCYLRALGGSSFPLDGIPASGAARGAPAPEAKTARRSD